MQIIDRFSNWYENAKDYVTELFWNGPSMVRVQFCEGMGEHWTNYYGWVPRNFWGDDLRQAGLIDLMAQSGMRLGWHPDAWLFPHSVRLLDMALDRNGHRAKVKKSTRKAESRKTRNK
jgi:hypothetical protein